MLKRLVPLSFALLLIFGISSVYAQTNPDSDNDGLPNSADQCPFEAGPRTNNGCPVDSDGDGTPDSSDVCPDVAGTRANGGCPDSSVPQSNDNDGDGTLNDSDACPEQGGPSWNDGCPSDSTAPDGSSSTSSTAPVLIAIPDDGTCSAGVSVPTNRRDLPMLNSTIVGVMEPAVLYPVLAQFLNINENRTWLLIEPYSFVAADIVVMGGDCSALNTVTFDGSQGEAMTADSFFDIFTDFAVPPAPYDKFFAMRFPELVIVIGSAPDIPLTIAAVPIDPTHPIDWFLGDFDPDPEPRTPDSIRVGFIPDPENPPNWGIYPIYNPQEPQDPPLTITPGIPDGLPGPGIIIDDTVQAPDLSPCHFYGYGLPSGANREYIVIDPSWVYNIFQEYHTVFAAFAHLDIIEDTTLQIVAADANNDMIFAYMNAQITNGDALIAFDNFGSFENMSLPLNESFGLQWAQQDQYKTFVSVVDYEVPLEIIMQCTD